MMRMLIDRLEILIDDNRVASLVTDICLLIESTLDTELLDRCIKKLTDYQLNPNSTSSPCIDIDELIEDL